MNRKPVESVCWLSKLKKGELKRKENQKKKHRRSRKGGKKGGSEGGKPLEETNREKERLRTPPHPRVGNANQRQAVKSQEQWRDERMIIE